IRVADVVVVKEVLRQRMKVIDINGPTLNGNGQAELVLLVAFAMQRNEAQIIAVRELEQRTAYGDERRCLVILAPEAAKKPIDPGKPQGRSKTRTGGILHHAAIEMRLTNAAG